MTLDRDLARHVRDVGGFTMIHHPLSVTIYGGTDMEVEHQNRHIAFKRERLSAAIAAADWATVIFLHERPYRTQSFDEWSDLMDDATYWQMAAEVWIDQEDPEDYADEWRERFTVDRAGREALMDDEERAALAALPEIVTIYRGDISDDPTGLSWSTSREVAEWFAKRFGGSAPVRTATIARDRIAAYWTRRGESEVLVLDPSDLRM